MENGTLRKGILTQRLIGLFHDYPGEKSVRLEPIKTGATPEQFRIALLDVNSKKPCPTLLFFDFGKALISMPEIARAQKLKLFQTFFDRILDAYETGPSLVEFRVRVGLIRHAAERKIFKLNGPQFERLKEMETASTKLGDELKEQGARVSSECMERNSCSPETYRALYANLEYEIERTRALSQDLQKWIKGFRRSAH